MRHHLSESFARIARDEPSRVLIHAVSEGRTITAAALLDDSLVAQGLLTRAGLTAGDVVVSIAGNRSGFLTLLAAAFALDIAVMPSDKSTTILGGYALADSYGAAALVLPKGVHSDRLPDEGIDLPGGVTLHLLPPERRLSFPGTAIMKLTSGSTGERKATATTGANAWHDARSIVEAMDIRPADTQLAVLPLSHAYGLGNLVNPLLLQGTAIVLRESFVPAQVRADIAAFGIRVFNGVPFMFEHLLSALPPNSLAPALEVLISAGAPIHPTTVVRFKERFGLKIHSFYGTSEAGGIAYDATDEITEAVTVGRPLPRVTIVCRQMESDHARIHVSGPAVAPGYADHGDGCAEGFVDGGFLTGDIGHFDLSGNLHLTGRVSSFVNIAGHKVQPAEVEQTLRDAPGVLDVRVVGVSAPRRGQMLVACIVADGPGVKPSALREYCAGRLSPHKIPREFLMLDQIPVDLRGKFDRQVIEAHMARRRFER